MKKIISILVIAALVAMMGVAAFAADTENYYCDFETENSDFKCYQPSEANGFIADGKLTMAVWWPTMVNLDNHTFGDATYEFDMNVGADKDWAGVMFCKTNPEHTWDHSGYMFYVRPDGSYDFGVSNGGFASLATGTIEGFVNEENHYKIVKSGESIKIYFGETLIVDVTDATYTEGYFSFVSSSAGTNAHTTLDNLSIMLPVNEEPAPNPDTGDMIAVVLAVMAVSGIGLVTVSKKHYA